MRPMLTRNKRKNWFSQASFLLVESDSAVLETKELRLRDFRQRPVGDPLDTTLTIIHRLNATQLTA